MSKKFDDVCRILGKKIKEIIINIPRQDMVEEIRLRAGKPLMVKIGGTGFFVSNKGGLSSKKENGYIVETKDIAEALTLISDYSIYAFEEEIKKGFITIRGGHRVGICGRTVMDGKAVKTIKHISALNIRVSHEKKGAADRLMSHIVVNGAICHTIIVSPPGYGKTTLLRDIVRQLSNGVAFLGFEGAAVAVVDERSEIAGSHAGIPQNDVGVRTDVLDCCPKAVGMQMLLRSMSPDCVAVDEIGQKEDIYAIEEMLNAGIKLICTVHGEKAQDLKQKPYIKELMEKKLFEKIIVLSGNKAEQGGWNRLIEVYNSDFELISLS